MGRGPSVVACPEEGGREGWGWGARRWPVAQSAPSQCQPIEGLYPQQVLGLRRPWGAEGLSPPGCTFRQRPLGAVSLRPLGPLHPISGMGGILGVGMEKGRDGDR